MTPLAAVILAAGCGRRLADAVHDRPKGLIELGGRSLVDRILALLKERGVGDVTLGTGFKRDLFQPLIAKWGVEEVINPDFERTGTLRSLALAIDRSKPRDVLLVEGDLFFDERGLDALIAEPWPDAVLTSGPTGAGDEVWICAPSGRILGLSKNRSDLESVDEEFVGVSRLSANLVAALCEKNDRCSSSISSYETDGIHEICATFDVRSCHVADLLWGEIDDTTHMLRLRDRVFPAYVARSLALSSRPR